MSAILFLDFDGVLNHRRWLQEHGEFSFDPSNVAQVNEIVTVTGAEIVVSSDWRLHLRWEYLCGRLADAGLAKRPLDRTPLVEREGPFGPRISRGHEVDAWLQMRRFTGNFVILDDRGDMEPHLDRLVQTDPAFGLTEADARRAVDALTNRDTSRMSFDRDELDEL